HRNFAQCKNRLFKGSMRLDVDKWDRVEVTEPANFVIKEYNNLSLAEYEFVNVVEEFCGESGVLMGDSIDNDWKCVSASFILEKVTRGQHEQNIIILTEQPDQLASRLSTSYHFQKIPVKFCPRRPEDATEVYAPIDKAASELDWK
ncbi:nucleic acid-binding, OB-fold-like protein, partial [Tanacetum coccineum]